MAVTEIRAKEANIQITVDGQRMGGSFATVYDLSAKPKKTIENKRFPGEKRESGDIDIKGYEFSFKTQLRDHLWKTVQDSIESADANGLPFPVISIAVTYSYRDGSANVRTNTLHGGLVMSMDDSPVPMDGYIVNSWTGFCSYCTGG